MVGLNASQVPVMVKIELNNKAKLFICWFTYWPQALDSAGKNEIAMQAIKLDFPIGMVTSLNR